MTGDPEGALLPSQLVRHPLTAELFMIDRDSGGRMLALAGPLARRLVRAGAGPRALISLSADLDWFVRPVESAPDEDAEDSATVSDDLIGAVLAWAEATPWQPVAGYRRVDEFGPQPPADDDAAPEPRFIRTIYLLESLQTGNLPAPATADPARGSALPSLWSGPGPVSLG